MKILVENSGWGNVGEAWYRISLYELLKKLYPNDDVYCGEGPIYRSFRVKNNWEKNNGLNLFDYQSADVYIYIRVPYYHNNCCLFMLIGLNKLFYNRNPMPLLVCLEQHLVNGKFQK